MVGVFLSPRITFFNMQNSTIVSIDKEGNILSVDKNCCRLFGYELEELVGHPLTTLIPSPYKEQHDTYLQNYAKTRVPKIIGKSRIVEGQHKDTSIFPIRLSVSQVGSGEDVIFIGVIDKLEDQSAQVTINAQGIIISCNQNVQELFGYKTNELIGKNVNVLMPAPYKENHDTYLANYIKGGAPKVIGKVRNVAGRHSNGTVFPISLQVEQLKIGQLTLFRGKIEKVESMEAVFTIDEKGTIINCNKNFVTPLFGYEPQDLLGKSISILIPQIHHSENSNSLQGQTSTKDPEPDSKRQKLSSQETLSDSWKSPGIHLKQLKHKDGSAFPVFLEIFSFSNNGTTAYSVRIKRMDSQHEKEYLAENSDLGGKMIGDYSILRTVGQGTYGKVKLGLQRDKKLQVAIKMLQKAKMSPLDLERAGREIDILKQLDHVNIAKLIEVIETEDHLNIVMEYAERTLLSYVLDKGGLGEDEARDFFVQMLSAINYCHRKNIIHRDIKHQNILLKNGIIKIIDFGLSNFIEDGKLRATFCGTPAYASPEMILGKKYNGPEVDVWSLGVVLYSMITGNFPFDSVADIIQGKFNDPPNVSKECSQLIRKMLTVDIEQRISIQKLLETEWVKHGATKAEKLDNSNSNAHLQGSQDLTASPAPQITQVSCTVISTQTLNPSKEEV